MESLFKKFRLVQYPLCHSAGSLDFAPGPKAGETPHHIETYSNIFRTFKSENITPENAVPAFFMFGLKLNYNYYKSADGDAIL